MENRLIDFSVKVVESVDVLNKNDINQHLTDQVIRSCTACSLNYGEAQSAESKRDFIHKLGIVMKELRETQINLKMLDRLNQATQNDPFPVLIKENDELLAIIFKTIQTTKKNM
jgi:four helix bundle protein